MVHTGVTDLAYEIGMTTSHVSKLLRGGMTKAQIRTKYAKQKEAEAVANPKILGRRAANQARRAIEAGVEVGVPTGNGKVNGNAHTDEPTSFTIADKIQAEIRKERALASKHELELAAKRGEYVPVVTVNEWFGNVIVKARDRLMRIPAEVAERVVTMEAEDAAKLIEDEIVQALGMLATLDGA
jgi:hypothetical protein